MSQVRVEPDQLDNSAGNIRTNAQKIQLALDEVEKVVASLGEGNFSGKRAEDFRAKYNQLKTTTTTFAPLLERFAVTLETSARDFRTIDNRLSSST